MPLGTGLKHPADLRKQRGRRRRLDHEHAGARGDVELLGGRSQHPVRLDECQEREEQAAEGNGQ